jgi:LmbE family N-acetylglucosaminyl deacetylase
VLAPPPRSQRVICITATDGEQGTSSTHPDPVSLAPLRRRELTAALGKLGVQEHLRFGLPDGGCDALGERAPVERLRRAVDWFGADTVVTFGPDGITGHPDHIAVSRWVDLAIARATRPVRVLHAVTTPEHLIEFEDIDTKLGLYPDGPPLTARPDELAAELVLDAPLLARKLAALRAHDSQTSAVFDVLGMQRMAEWVRTESFVDA